MTGKQKSLLQKLNGSFAYYIGADERISSHWKILVDLGFARISDGRVYITDKGKEKLSGL